MKYWLHRDRPYDAYIAEVGHLDKIKEWIKKNPHVSVDDLTLFVVPDIDIVELVGEVRGKDYYGR